MKGYCWKARSCHQQRRRQRGSRRRERQRAQEAKTRGEQQQSNRNLIEHKRPTPRRGIHHQGIPLGAEGGRSPRTPTFRNQGMLKWSNQSETNHHHPVVDRSFQVVSVGRKKFSPPQHDAPGLRPVPPQLIHTQPKNIKKWKFKVENSKSKKSICITIKEITLQERKY